MDALACHRPLSPTATSASTKDDETSVGPEATPPPTTLVIMPSFPSPIPTRGETANSAHAPFLDTEQRDADLARAHNDGLCRPAPDTIPPAPRTRDIFSLPRQMQE